MKAPEGYSRDRYYLLKGMGICPRCGNANAEPGKTCCLECLRQNLNCTHARREARKLAGVA